MMTNCIVSSIVVLNSAGKDFNAHSSNAYGCFRSIKLQKGGPKCIFGAHLTVCRNSAVLASPLDAPHHMRQNEQSPFREGATLSQPPGERPGGGKIYGSFVDVGLKHPVLIDRKLKAGMRVTVKMDNYDRKGRKCACLCP